MAHLTSRHYEELCASGLTMETIEQSGIWSAAEPEVQLILGPKNWGPGMVFPYRALREEVPSHHVVKLDMPSTSGAINRQLAMAIVCTCRTGSTWLCWTTSMALQVMR